MTWIGRSSPSSASRARTPMWKKAARCPPPERARPSFGSTRSSVTDGTADHTLGVAELLPARPAALALSNDLLGSCRRLGPDDKLDPSPGRQGVPTPSPPRRSLSRPHGNLARPGNFLTGRPRRGGRYGCFRGTSADRSSGSRQVSGGSAWPAGPP